MSWPDPDTIRAWIETASLLTVFCAQFLVLLVMVAFRAAQQHNVLKYRYLAVWPCSFVMAGAEF